jgi:ABC transporter substrate binding protein
MAFYIRWSLCLCCLGLLAHPVCAESKKRIGYLEAGPLANFTETIRHTTEILRQQGWGDKIELVKDACFSPGWSQEQKKQLPEKAKELMNRTDLDLIIGGGTSAVRSLLEYNNHRVSIVGIAVSDPIKTTFKVDGKETTFVVSEQDSGIDNFTIRIVPNQYKRMFEIFYDEVGFKKLGLLYVDEKNKNNVTSVDDAYEVSKSGRHFEILEQRIANPETGDCYNGLEALIKLGIDAFFIPSLSCFDWDEADPKKANPTKLLKLLRDHKILTFSRQGNRDVQGGAMMGLSTLNYHDRGEFTADSIMAILSGKKKPRELPMTDKAPPKITINLEVAQELGFTLSFDVLGASDELYEKITVPEKNPAAPVCNLF